jgi:hypothetical protein
MFPKRCPLLLCFELGGEGRREGGGVREEKRKNTVRIISNIQCLSGITLASVVSERNRIKCRLAKRSIPQQHSGNAPVYL